MTLSSMHFSRVAPFFVRLLLLLALLLPTWANAQIGFGLDARVEHIKNPLLLADSDDDEMLSSVTATAQLERQTRLLTSVFNYSINRQEYDQDFLSDQTFVSGAGSLTLNIVPELFTWNLSNTRSNQLIDISRPGVLDNRQVIDYTVTGPSLVLPFGQANFVNISAQFGIVDYADFDSLKHNRNTASASYTRLLDQRFTVSIQTNFTDTDYTNSQALNYKLSSVQGELGFVNGDLNVTTVLGEQSTERAGVRTSSPIHRLNIQYQINGRLSVSAAYTDSVEDLLSDLASPSAVDQRFVNSAVEIDGNFGSTNAANLYQRRERSVGAIYTIPLSYSLALRYSNNIRRNIGRPDGNSDERLSTSLSKPVGNRWRFSTSIEHSNRLFSLAKFELERTSLRVGVDYKVSDRLSLVFSAMDTKQQNRGSDDYIDGHNISLGLSFRP